MPADILIVDDEADIRGLIADILQDEHYSTRTAGDSDSALRAIAERVPSLVILDIWLQGSELDGLGVLEILQEKHPQLPVLMISGHGNIETAVTAMKIGAFDFIEKPFKEERLLMMVSRAMENARLRQENNELKLRGAPESNLIGQSPKMNMIRSAIKKVAPTHSRVMISGPAGTGKGVIARVMHDQSARAQGPFVVLNAASMTSERVEAELFGVEDTHPNGGARQIGVFERAHHGTLFIDEVADMPIQTQGKFLRALQEQGFERVGGTRRVEVDVRIIAASNRDLKAEIAAGRLREDLYYRLNVVPMDVPSLRERREDIPELCQYFIKRAVELSGLPRRILAEDTVAALQAYSWPGNVRQLRNLMEWLLIMTPGDAKMPIRSNMLPAELFEDSPASLKAEINSDIMAMPLREARELFEKQYLSAQIERFGGNISKTSHFVGMERSALHRKLKLLGLASSRSEDMAADDLAAQQAAPPKEEIMQTQNFTNNVYEDERLLAKTA